ncbi:GTP pyrophosphokinase [Schaedlerella arabinosiphila]|uniref:GTP pyrophosphokinase n=1 Tax=Schaedlerella arabinosiphila TaxID=2044587 RepID=A0A9X5H609_9FIRM|nr:GTP pyrophosphokinase [Schaedlerella arabinosiphila]MCI9633227.1 GTP pyrophosphokinase [Ruminococcus sp.]NDO68633.1 GTP pyrophosphokinase [Schaedlerella arabinosiphila]
MITKESFLEKYNITEDLFLSAEISWNDLCDIYNDFLLNKFDKYEHIREEFLNEYLKDINKSKSDTAEKVKVHSYLSRVKDPEHLIAKIVRKKQDNYSKYRNLDKTNYEKFITDLIGIRCLVLFKADWTSFHNYIMSQFDNNVNYYIKDSILDFDDDEDHFYIAEKPKVHIRNGDARELYDSLLPPDCVIDGKVYRSVHYIIKYKGVYLEIQVRTLFEEGWGEIDHAVVYPYFQNDQILKEYTELLNRLSGLADEMSGFFYRLKKMEIEYLKSADADIKNPDKKGSISDSILPRSQGSHESLSITSKSDTPYDCLRSILDE